MTKALFKKQMREVFSFLYQDRKTAKLRTKKGIILYFVLYLLLFGFLGVIFGFLASMICPLMLEMNLGWIYWCLMGVLSVFLGVFGSVFNTYSSLYLAKDNDLLLSMPIPVSRILQMRLIGVYTMGLLYELLVMIPTVIVWLWQAPFSLLGTIHVILIPLVLSVFILVFSAFFGWVVAVIAAKAKHKNILVVVLSVAFFGVYYYVCGMATSILERLVINVDKIGGKLKSILYLLYQMGLAAEGSVSSMVIFCGIIAIMAAITYLVLERSFLRIATANVGAAKTIRKEKRMKKSSVSSALLRKELLRFTGSANYMLNCGMAILVMPISAAVLVWKADSVNLILSLVSEEIAVLAAIAAICLIAAMNDMAAPSVSLEGKNLWILRVFPVSGWEVVMAKYRLQVILTVIPAIPLMLAAEWLIRPSWLYAIALPAVVVLFISLMAAVDLSLNLKLPNLQWNNEIVPIKSSMPVMIGLLGGWVLVIVLAGIYIWQMERISAGAYLVVILLILAAANAGMISWLRTKGAALFENLQ